jgi:hypothetical protein
MKRPYHNNYDQIIEYVAVGVFDVILAAHSLARPSTSSTNSLLNAAPAEQSRISTNNNTVPNFAFLK